MEATDLCRNCHQEFADHNYVPDSIDKYACPYPQQESVYGYYAGGDPRSFSPDGECCTPAELKNHRKACELWNIAEADGYTPTPEKCPSGWLDDGKGNRVHVLRAPYGIGIQTIEFESYFEPIDFDYEIT